MSFNAFTNGIPFQTEPCPHMNEGIRTPIREFLNSLEQDHHGIKNNMYRSIQRIIRSTESVKQAKVCAKCGSKCTGEVCSVCRIIQSLEPNANINTQNNHPAVVGRIGVAAVPLSETGYTQRSATAG